MSMVLDARFHTLFKMAVYYKMQPIMLHNATAILLQNTSVILQNATILLQIAILQIYWISV